MIGLSNIKQQMNDTRVNIKRQQDLRKAHQELGKSALKARLKSPWMIAGIAGAAVGAGLLIYKSGVASKAFSKNPGSSPDKNSVYWVCKLVVAPVLTYVAHRLAEQDSK